VALAQAKLIADSEVREQRLGELRREFSNADGSIEALFELGLLKINLYKSQTNSEKKGDMLKDAINTLESFKNLYPDSAFSTQVKELLNRLPVVSKTLSS